MKRLSQKHRLRQLRIQRRRVRQRSANGYVRVERDRGRLLVGYRVLQAPRVLHTGDMHMPALIAYLDKVHRLALGGNRRVVVDLSQCQSINPTACLMLTAELQRCLILRPGCVTGLDPENRFAQFTLDALGFYKTLGMTPPRRTSSHGLVLQIQSGGLDDKGDAIGNVGHQTFQVAKIARQAFKDEVFADRVHAALNEAADNSINWAYDDELINPKRSTRRWWICGFRVDGQEKAFFFAYDQGAGIPKTAPKTSRERINRALLPLLNRLGLRAEDAEDHHVLRATIDEQRTRSALEQRGKGLTRMIELVDVAGNGVVQILSGRAAYVYSRETEEDGPVEISGPLPYNVPGTLVMWSVLAPHPDPEAQES